MAKKPATSKNTGPSSQTHRQGNSLFARLGPAKIRDVVEALVPELALDKPRSFVMRSADVLEINCILPDHKDDTPSCVIDCRKGTVHCYGSGCGYHSSNLLQFLQDATGSTFKELITQIHTVTGIRAVNDKVSKELEALDDHQQMTALAMEVFNAHLLRCIDPPKGNHPYARDYSPAFMSVIKHTLDWLFVERGRDPKHARSLPYGILPSQEMATRFAHDVLEKRMMDEARTGRISMTKERRERVEKLFEEMVGRVDPRWIHCVTFHTGYGLTTPGRIRLRLPRNDKTEGTDELPGFTQDDPVGYFGLYLPQYRVFSPQEVRDLHVITVEGENDALAYMEKILDAGKVGVRVIASSGKRNGLDLLVDAGITRCHLFGDEPSEEHGKGEDWVRHMLASTERMDARVFTGWHELKEGMPKDPDEAIRLFGFDKVYALTAGPNAKYMSSEVWALERLADNIAGMGLSETREKLRWAIEYGQCVRNHAALAVYLEHAGRLVGIPPASLRREITKTGFTEEGYVARLADTIIHEFHRTCRDDTDGKGGGEIELFHRATQTRLRFFLTDGKGMVAQFSSVFGDMWRFFKDNVGLPPKLDDANLDGVPSTLTLPEKLKLLTSYMEMAMQTVVQGVPSRSECDEIGQGVWYKDDPDRPGTKCLYVVNGFKVYKGVFRSGGEPTVEWAQLAGPSDGRYIFNVEKDKVWSREIAAVDDLNAANEITREQVHEVVKKIEWIFRRFWNLKYRDTDATFLGYHLAALAVGCAYVTKSVVHLLGDTNAGKSSAMALAGGKQFPGMNLVEAAGYSANYSAAYIYQTWNYSMLAMLLDEFEAEQTSGHSASHKGKAVENISELIRQIATEGGTSPGRGSNDGSTKRYHLHTHVMLASMLKASLPQDNNRRMAIEIYRNDDPEARAPEIAIFDEIPHERYRQMRRTLTLGLLRFIPEIQRNAEEVRADLARVKRVPFSVPTRFSDNLIPAVSLMRFFGAAWEEYLVNTFTQRREALQQTLEDTSANALVQRVIGTPNVVLGDNARASISQLLSRADQTSMLNGSGCGVVFDEARKVIIIDWFVVTATGGLLSRTFEYVGKTPQQLKHMCDQHPDAVRPAEYETYGVAATLRALGFSGNARTTSAVKVDTLVKELRTASAPAPAKPTGPGTVTPIRPSASAAGGGGSDNL